MASKNEKIKAAAYALCELEGLDPSEEIAHYGRDYPPGSLRVEGRGITMQQFGPRYLAHWKEASRFVAMQEALDSTP